MYRIKRSLKIRVSEKSHTGLINTATFLTPPILILDPVPGVRNKIQTTIGARYYIDCPETKNFDSLTQKFDELETTLTDFLPGHKKTIHPKGNDGDFYQLIKETSFTIVARMTKK